MPGQTPPAACDAQPAQRMACDPGLAPVILQAEAFVRREVAAHDASHSYDHIDRVRQNALTLAAAEGVADSHTLAVIELAALLHDVCDWKYAKDEGAAAAAITGFLQEQGVEQGTSERVLAIIARVGFKEELAGGASSGAGGGGPGGLSLEAAVVQDADRLDAIGAIGIARCLTFGGRFNRVLYDPEVPPRVGLTKEQYMKGGGKSTTINHFYEKLLLLKDLMKTQSGRRMAEARHAYMVDFLGQFEAEVQGRR